jgi:hypothetical protein
MKRRSLFTLLAAAGLVSRAHAAPEAGPRADRIELDDAGPSAVGLSPFCEVR